MLSRFQIYATKGLDQERYRNGGESLFRSFPFHVLSATIAIRQDQNNARRSLSYKSSLTTTSPKLNQFDSQMIIFNIRKKK